MSEYKLPELPEPEYVFKGLGYAGSQLLALHRQGWDEAITALQQQAGQAEPVAVVVDWSVTEGRRRPLTAEFLAGIPLPPAGTKLYTAPPRVRVTRKRLTEVTHRLIDETDAGRLLSESMLAALQSLGINVEVSDD